MRIPTDLPGAKPKPIHPHAWLWEPLADEPSFVLRSMFGAKAVYLDGRLMLCFCAKQEPWRGMLVCTDRDRQTTLRTEFTELTPHPILPKWLYLPETADTFERTAATFVRLVRRRDPRLGVVPRPRKKQKGDAKVEFSLSRNIPTGKKSRT